MKNIVEKRRNCSSFPQYLLPGVRFSSLESQLYCSKFIFHCVLIFPCRKSCDLYVNYILQKSNLISWANTSLLIAILYCVLIINCSKLLSGANILRVERKTGVSKMVVFPQT